MEGLSRGSWVESGLRWGGLSDFMNKFLVALVSILILNSCASFIDRPKELKEWKYEEKSSCPKVFKVYSERHLDYYLGDKHIYTCEVVIDGKGRVKCDKKSSFRMDSLLTENYLKTHHEAALKSHSESFKCLKPSSKADAEYEVIVKMDVYEPDNLVWAIITGASLAIVPLRTTQELKNEILIKNLKSSQISKVAYESHVTFWMHLLLLPLSPFYGDHHAQAKLRYHREALIYNEIMKMSLTVNGSIKPN